MNVINNIILSNLQSLNSFTIFLLFSILKLNKEIINQLPSKKASINLYVKILNTPKLPKIVST